LIDPVIEVFTKEVSVLRRTWLFTKLALVGALGLARGIEPAGAQPLRPRFELVPRAGALAPLTDLGTITDIETLLQVKVELNIAFTAGLIAQYTPTFTRVSFRAAFDYTLFGATTEAQPLACEIVTGPACRKVGVDTRYLTLAGDVLIRASEFEESSVYLLVGAGIKRYEFAEINCAVDDLVCSLLDNFVRNQTNPTLHLGLGLDFRFGPARLEAELADYLSWHQEGGGEESSGEVQQDLLLTLGLRLGIG
jgi:hypothetical protein